MISPSNGRATKHEALTQRLLEMINDLKPGDRVPSQNELMRTYQVSDRTVLRSLDDLRRAGWIVRRHGSGTYVADPAERQSLESPRPGASTTVASLVPSFGPYHQHCLDLFSHRASAAGLSMVCQHVPEQSTFADLMLLEALNPRGFVLFGYRLLSVARCLAERGRRVVIVGSPQSELFTEAPCVYADRELGGWTACRHLIELGHRRILFFGGRKRPSSEGRRRHGHERALADAREERVEVRAAYAEHSLLAEWCAEPAMAARFFRASEAPTAVALNSDSDGVSLISALHTAGLRVPQDVSVVGFGRLPVGDTSAPPLTTVDLRLDVQLRAALEVINRDEPPPSSFAYVVAPGLVERTSTASPSSR